MLTSRISRNYLRGKNQEKTILSLLLCFSVALTIIILAWPLMANNQVDYTYNNLIPHQYLQETNINSTLQSKTLIHFMLIADLDKNSKIYFDSTEAFQSFKYNGVISITNAYIQDNNDTNTQTHNNTQAHSNTNTTYTITLFDEDPLISFYSYKSRGMELSELLCFNGKMLTFDDHTGMIFTNLEGPLIPLYILPEGDGLYHKGMKIEWATVKDKTMYVGSFGKEYTVNGAILHTHNMWVTTIREDGYIERLDWTKNYEAIRTELDVPFPGYVIHEAVNWSSFHNMWVFLPRRISQDPYHDVLDQYKGSNVIIFANHDFTSLQTVTVGDVTPEKGFSSFKFLPNSEDKIIVALRTVEINEKDIQMTYITIFDIFGNILLPDMLVSDKYKYEGIEFLC